MYKQYLKQLMILLFLSCVQATHPMIPQVIDLQKITSQDFIKKFDQLRQLTQQNPAATDIHASRAYSQLFDPNGIGRGIINMVNAASQTGLVAQYKGILTNTNQNITKGFIQAYLSPNALAVIAYLQNLYGNGQPFVYNPPMTLPQPVPNENPSLAVYVSPQGKRNITSYGFLRGLFDAIDQVKMEIQNYSIDQQNNFIRNLRELANNLDTAIVEQRQRSASLNLDSIIDQIRNLVKQGNTQILQELNTIVNRYQR